MKNLDTFKSISDISKTWATNPVNDLLKTNQLYSNFNELHAIAALQSSIKSISDNPLADAYFKAKGKEKEKDADNKKDEKK